MAICFLGIGSNLGNRRANIRKAMKEINSLDSTRALKSSHLIETIALGGPVGQPKFLNGALKIKTNLTPSALLKALKNIEKKLGRKKTVRNGPRTIDLDILFYADKVINTKQLQIPHPRLFERDFVLRPLAEVV